MKLTGETITDEQIRQERRRQPHLLDTLMIAMHSEWPDLKAAARGYFARLVDARNEATS